MAVPTQGLVFRPDAGRERRSGLACLTELESAIRQRSTLDALLRAGELECFLADRLLVDHAGGGAFPVPPSQPNLQPKQSQDLTSALARALVFPEHEVRELDAALRQLREVRVPVTDVVELAAPEGFAYYALHPLDYAAAARGLDRSRPWAVVGIRGIGATLSAIAAAVLDADRITVRPQGHPYDRKLELDALTLPWVRGRMQAGCRFLVADEGPGLSGSSFLSTGEALLAAGVRADDVTFLCSRKPEPEQLVAPSAAVRWKRFHCVTAASPGMKPSDAEPLAGWDWRRQFLTEDEQQWPAVWTQMSAPKWISRDRKRFYRFEGLGRYGAALRDRSQQLYEAGWGPQPADAGNGYSNFAILDLPQINTLSHDAMAAIAEYCAFRAGAFSVTTCDARALEDMANFNLEQLGSRELLKLPVERPVIADARMMPYEWRRRRAGDSLWKLDAAAHGDGHFFPGPCDIAWDLAGAVVEWKMDSAASEAFLGRYRQASGDDASLRIAPYLTAYCAFQNAYARMAAAATAACAESARLGADAERYGKAALPLSAMMNA